jgi:hypothetical protein
MAVFPAASVVPTAATIRIDRSVYPGEFLVDAGEVGTGAGHERRITKDELTPRWLSRRFGTPVSAGHGTSASL